VIANWLAVISAIASLPPWVIRGLPWTAGEKIHALATNETRHRKRRITPGMLYVSLTTAGNITVMSLSLTVVKRSPE
jgi:hypothetical protein